MDGVPTAFDEYTSQIKSRERVRDNGEVFTASREVDAMVSLLPASVWSNPSKRFLEPACGHGNIVTQVVKRKITSRLAPSAAPSSEYEFFLLRVVASVYGIDISADNVSETRSRVLGMIQQALPLPRGRQYDAFEASVRHVLNTNIVHGDGLTGLANPSGTPEPFTFTEYRAVRGHRFIRTIQPYRDLANSSHGPAALFSIGDAPRVIPSTHYLSLHVGGDGVGNA